MKVDLGPPTSVVIPVSRGRGWPSAEVKHRAPVLARMEPLVCNSLRKTCDISLKMNAALSSMRKNRSDNLRS